jgi:methylated-DNA-protein-cysteine methyltransferase-like protein
MARSVAYLRIRTHVLAIARAVPEGKVVTHEDIGQFLDVMPRHVAYILATLTADEREVLPWHRVVGTNGELKEPNPGAKGPTQADLLERDGVPLNKTRERVVRLQRVSFSITIDNTGVVPVSRQPRA